MNDNLDGARKGLVIIGHGRMGKAVDELAASAGFRVDGRLTGRTNQHAKAMTPELFENAKVAVDFSTPEAMLENVPRAAELGVNLVIGTTGWSELEADLRRTAVEAGIGVVAAPNFSVGVNLFLQLVRHAARLFRSRTEFGGYIHEVHHRAKADSPSGTAAKIRKLCRDESYSSAIDVAANRAGHAPGTHSLAFDGPSETVTVTHITRDRSTFARGALLAAHWIHGRRGWFTMADVMEIRQ